MKKTLIFILSVLLTVAIALTFVACGKEAVVGLNNTLTSGQANTHAAGRVTGQISIQWPTGLDSLTNFTGQPLSAIPNLYNRPVVLSKQVQPNVFTISGVADGVLQQIHHDLFNQDGVHRQVQNIVGEI